MGLVLDTKMLTSLFLLPGEDGSYTQEYQTYFDTISKRKPVAIFAFPPKCGGTFLRSAAITATGGQLYRASYTQGGGEMQFYLPTFMAYFNTPDLPQMVTHVHMQARQSCCNFIRLMNLRPVTMIRSIPDMLISYRDQFLREEGAMRENMICEIPADFPQRSQEQQADFILHMMAPWYVSYFATWLDFARKEPERTMLLRFKELRTNPVETLTAALEHFRLSVSKEACENAIGQVWQHRDQFRFNKGVAGRGRDFFSAAQLAQLENMLAQYPVLDPYRDELL